MTLSKDLSKYLTLEELQQDLDAAQKAGTNLFADLTYYLAIQDRASELIEAGLETVLGEEKYLVLVELRRMSLSYAELLLLTQEKLLKHGVADRPAEAPMSGRVQAHIFSFIFEGTALCTFEIEMPTTTDLIAQANFRLGNKPGEVGAVNPKEVVPAIVDELKGPIREERLEKARNLIRVILNQ